MKPWLFVAVALVSGLAYVFVTPPLAVPDESNHLWRALAIARGHLIPGRGLDAIALPKSTQDLVWILDRQEQRETLAQKLRLASTLPFDRRLGGTIRFAAWYTPMPYVVQSLVAILPLRPLVLFYAGRVANLIVAIMLIAMAIRAAPQLSGVMAAVALLPMSLYELASWSADAATMALAWLFTALLLAPERRLWAVATAGLALGLCKPAYFLIALLALAVELRWRERIAIIGATAAGTLLALAAASRGAYNPRVGLPVDAAAQIRCIAANPMRFAGVAIHDAVTNGRFYLEEMVGRFGANELKLSPFIITAELLLLLTVAITTGAALRGRVRMAAVAITVMTVCGILLSQYLIWSIVCGDTIEGVQGRYFLEILPLLLAAIAVQRIRWRAGPWVIVAVSIVCNGMAMATLVRRYW
ncbi:MAG TPA: DUF2142 domain-containing protein [Thermoanaerobaculia bacterium]|nr:DUF2142 domain-containing protein [Thermoanaerobaculia bacterium]